MASWSAFSFSGWAPFESYGEGRMEHYFLGRNADLINGKTLEMTRETPMYQRQGLERAGYNPLLAVSNPSPVVGSSSPAFSGGTSTAGAGRFLDYAAQKAQIRLTDAQARRVEAEIGVDAWRPVTVSRSDAAGFGTKILGKLGLNLHNSKATSFTLFYNPVTGELKNPYNGMGVNDSQGNTAQDFHGSKEVRRVVDSFIRPENKEQPKKDNDFSGDSWLMKMKGY